MRSPIVHNECVWCGRLPLLKGEGSMGLDGGKTFPPNISFVKLRYRDQDICLLCLYRIDPSLIPPQFSESPSDTNCRVCKREQCLNLTTLNRIYGDKYICCICDNERHKRITNEQCCGCYRIPLKKKRWTLNYFNVALECDVPILESLWHPDKQPWHSHIYHPKFNYFVIKSRRVEYQIINQSVFDSSTLSPIVYVFCEFLEEIGKTPDPSIRQHPTLQLFALDGSKMLLDEIAQILCRSEGVILLGYRIRASHLIEQIRKALNEHFPEVSEELDPLFGYFKTAHEIHVKGFFEFFTHANL